MRAVKFPKLALIGAASSPLLFALGFLFLFVSGIRYGQEPALAIGVALILLGLVLLISGIVLVGTYLMLKSALPEHSDDDSRPSESRTSPLRR
ncbi:hypothetical protein [Microbacterium sp. WCS2018Hpa-23]|uniref:hypothetical protein n=1 Tax=Microbacterium sp. WCS2018Hpa-23 TaxID=3073634 RepID=UPI00288316FB|nr:hypothetical protein [Microbacterium sp. WCS2018Hpa-23]